MSQHRVAVVSTHPVQYLGPLFRKLAAHPQIELTVLFCCDHGTKPSYDVEFNTTFAWERPLTDGYRHEFLPNIHPRPGPQSFWSRTNPTLLRRLNPAEFDAALIFGWGYASTWLAMAGARAHGVPLLVHAESNLGPDTRARWKAELRRVVLSRLFTQIDVFLAVGSKSREMYLEYGASSNRVFIVPYAVDNEFFEHERQRLAPRRVELRRELGVEDQRPIVVCSGKLLNDKAPLDLLAAFAAVRSELPAKLVFLGDGPLRPEVSQRAEELGVADDVRITGFMQQAKLGEVYVAADLLAFPSKRETWGIVVNEAMLFGLPVVCSDAVTAHHDLVVPGITGDVYRSGDVAALTAILCRRLRDPAAMSRMGAQGRERIQAWSYDACVDGTVQGIEVAVNARRH